MWLYLVEAIVFVLWYYLFCMKGDFRKVQIKEVIQPVNILVISLIAIGMCFFVNFQMPIVIKVLPESIVQEYSNMIEQAGYGVELIPTIICLILAPISEEFLYRGVLFYYLLKILETRLTKRKAFWIANVIQAFLFGWIHMNLIQGGYAFLIGIVLGFLVYQYGSVLPALIAHVINNFLSAFVWKLVIDALPQSSYMYVIGAGFSLCVVVMGIMLCVSNNEKINQGNLRKS